MSGSTGYSVRVESAEERLRRLTGEARARCNALEINLDGLRSLGVDAVRCTRPQGQGLDALGDYERRLGEAIAGAERRLAEQQAKRRELLILSGAGVSAGTSVGIGIADAVASHAQEQPGRVVNADAERQITELAGVAAELEDEALLADLVTRSRALREATGAEATRIWMQLQSDVATAVREQRVRHRCRQGAEAQVLRMAHLEGPQPDEIRADAAHVADDASLGRLRARVDEALVAAEREADADFVTEQARQAFESLGYLVDESFDIIGTDSQAFLARRRDLPDHALEIQVNAATGFLLTSVVSAEGTTVAADLEAERRTCPDGERLVPELVRRGVTATMKFQSGPGRVPMERTLDGAATAGRVHRPGKTSRPLEKGLGR